MADTEYEEFCKNLRRFPSNFKATTPFYSIVPNIDDVDSPSSSKSDSSDPEDEDSTLKQSIKPSMPTLNHVIQKLSINNDEDDEIGDGLRTTMMSGTAAVAKQTTEQQNHQQLQNNNNNNNSHLERTSSLPFMGPSGQTERRRRKLPEIPKNKKSSLILLCSGGVGISNGNNSINNVGVGGVAAINCGLMTENIDQQPLSLATELNLLQQYDNHNTSTTIATATTLNQRSILAYKCGYLMDEDSSPDSDRLLHSLGDVDSGHSTANSPNDFKSISPPLLTSISPQSSATAQSFSGGGGGSIVVGTGGSVPYSQLEMLDATHRGLHKFIPRHHDEIDVEIGDPIYVQKEADDLWCEGVNLRTGRHGIFPSAYAVDLDYNDFDPNAQKVKKERYLLSYLGSVETLAHKGTSVVCQAVRKIVSEIGESPNNGQTCILEISDQGLRMVDRSSVQGKEKKKPYIDYFYSLKNVSFCAFHPRDHRYIGFITKHPTVQRFACHVFRGHESTRPVAEAVGRAFQHFYQKFIETAYPIEDIYIE